MTAASVSEHPMLRAVNTSRRAFADVASVEPVYMTPGDKATALRGLAALKAQVEEAEMRLLAAAGDLAQDTGARDAGQWLAHEAHLDPRTCHSELKLAQAIDEKCSQVAASMRAGAVNRAQAQVIVTALEKLPPEIDQVTRRRAEKHLVELAGQFGPRELRTLGDRILSVVAPDIADEADARALEREERSARIKTSIRFKRLGDGITRIVGQVPDAVAARLETYLDAFSSPRVSTGERLPRSRRLGQAFCALLEHLDPKKLPDHGGDATTVMVTIPLEDLRRDLATAGIIGSLEGDLQITADEARRLACTAKIIPVVLGGKGEILDLGRAQRLFNASQRKALRLRDKQCRAEGCSIPATWCEAHHSHPWSAGGKTDLADGVLLCSHHHQVAHDPHMTHELTSTGAWRFHRRP
ncbi:HNH endonuclease signature motif containing protein [Nocardioides montaniterrae]